MKEAYFKDSLYYKVNDFTPNRPTLVFVHGLSGSSSAWIPYEKIFGDKYNILTFDIRGHGKSKKYPRYSNYEIKHFAADINELVAYLNIQKFVLISHSFGTLIAAEYIKQHREKVLANIFLSPIFGLEKDFIAKITRPILKLSKFLDWFPSKSKPGHHVDYNRYPNSTDWNLKRCYADVKNTTLRVYLYCLSQSMLLEQEYFLEKIKIPTLIIHGVKDSMAPAKNSVMLSKKIEKAELILIPDTDHIIVLNNIKEVSEAILSFIEKHKNLLQ